MAANFLKFINDKTELLLKDNPKRLTKIRDFELSIGDVRVQLSASVRNLRIYFDNTLSFKSLVPKIAASATFHIR